MTRPWVVAVAGGAVALIVVLTGVMAARWAAREEQPAPAVQITDDSGVTSTRLPTPDESYWTPERMRSAQPAPMPTE